MAYAGTTSTAPNPPTLRSQSIAGVRTWDYKSTHTQAIVAGTTGFFTDGYQIGMRNGDTVIVEGSTTYVASFHTVQVATSTGVGLSSGLLTSSAS